MAVEGRHDPINLKFLSFSTSCVSLSLRRLRLRRRLPVAPPVAEGRRELRPQQPRPRAREHLPLRRHLLPQLLPPWASALTLALILSRSRLLSTAAQLRARSTRSRVMLLILFAHQLLLHDLGRSHGSLVFDADVLMDQVGAGSAHCA